MKKSKLLMCSLVIAALFGTTAVQAQQVKGQNFLNAGIGIGSFGFVGTGGLPLNVSYEHGFTDKISAGATFAYVQTTFLGSLKYSNYVIGARGSYHFNELLKLQGDKVDVYGGASIFYRGHKVKVKGTEDGSLQASSGEADFSFHAGARYQFTPKVSGYGELGYGITPLQLGVSFRF